MGRKVYLEIANGALIRVLHELNRESETALHLQENEKLLESHPVLADAIEVCLDGAEDLVFLEEALLKMYRKILKLEDRFAKLTLELEKLFDEHGVPEDQRSVVREELRLCGSLGDGEKLLRGVSRRLEKERHTRWLAQLSNQKATTEEAEVSERRKESPQNLESMASKVTSERAKSFYQEALLSGSPRERRRLLRKALYEEGRALEAESGIEPEEPRETEPRDQPLKPQTKPLWETAREGLARMEHLVEGADWVMSREVVLSLAEIGSPGGRFNNHYRAVKSVQKRVLRQYDSLGLTFVPETFKTAIKVLTRVGVVIEKTQKEHDLMISLSSHVGDAKTEEAREIIGLILALKQKSLGIKR